MSPSRLCGIQKRDRGAGQAGSVRGFPGVRGGIIGSARTQVAETFTARFVRGFSLPAPELGVQSAPGAFSIPRTRNQAHRRGRDAYEPDRIARLERAIYPGLAYQIAPHLGRDLVGRCCKRDELGWGHGVVTEAVCGPVTPLLASN